MKTRPTVRLTNLANINSNIVPTLDQQKFDSLKSLKLIHENVVVAIYSKKIVKWIDWGVK